MCQIVEMEDFATLTYLAAVIKKIMLKLDNRASISVHSTGYSGCDSKRLIYGLNRIVDIAMGEFYYIITSLVFGCSGFSGIVG